MIDSEGLDSAAATRQQAQQSAAWIATHPVQFNYIMQHGMAQWQCIKKLFNKNFEHYSLYPRFQEAWDPFRSVPEFVEHNVKHFAIDVAKRGFEGMAEVQFIYGNPVVAKSYGYVGEAAGAAGYGLGVISWTATTLDTAAALDAAYFTVKSAPCKCQQQ